MRGKLFAGAVATIALAGCGSASSSRSNTSTRSSSATSSATQTTPQINTAKLSACIKVATDLQTIGSDLETLKAAMNSNGDTTTAATKLTQDADTAEPDVAKLRALVPTDQQTTVDQQSSVFAQYATAAQQVAAQDLQTGLETLISANGAQQSVNQQFSQICKVTK